MPTARAVAAGSLLAAAVVLAGCSAVPFMGPACGPGDTAIGDVSDNATSVHFKGELTAFNGSSLVIDDGTGTAEVLTLSDDVKSEVSTGDCIIAEGTATSDNGTHDAMILPTEGLWVEEYQPA